jgi:hypothetical protein
MNPQFIVQSFTSIRRNSLRGFATVRLPSGMVLSDVGIHYDSGKYWAAVPSKAMISRDGTLIKDVNGKIRYAPIISFASKELRDKFSQAVIAAVESSHPGELA